MTTLENIERIQREAVKNSKYKFEDEIHVRVQMGICSKAAGATEVVEALKDAVFHQNIQHVVFEKTGCSGICAYEPILTISRCGKEPVTYIQVTPERARILLSEYALKDHIIWPWTLNGKEVTL